MNDPAFGMLSSLISLTCMGQGARTLVALHHEWREQRSRGGFGVEDAAMLVLAWVLTAISAATLVASVMATYAALVGR